MKKILFFIIAISFFACEGPTGPEGPAGSNTSWHVESITIKKNEWKLSGKTGALNSYYYAEKPLKELTSFVYKQGLVGAYLQTDDKVKNEMPYVLHKGGVDKVGEFLWTQTYDFDFYTGGVCFYVTYSDFNTQIHPDEETFHVVLAW